MVVGGVELEEVEDVVEVDEDLDEVDDEAEDEDDPPALSCLINSAARSASSQLMNECG